MIRQDNRLSPYSVKSLLKWNGFKKELDGVYVHEDKNLRVTFGCNNFTIRSITGGRYQELWDGGNDRDGNPVHHPMHYEMYQRVLGWLCCEFDDVLVPNFKKTANDRLRAERYNKWMRKQQYNCQIVMKKMKRFLKEQGYEPNFTNVGWVINVFNGTICGSLKDVSFTVRCYEDGSKQFFASLDGDDRLYQLPVKKIEVTESTGEPSDTIK